MSNEQNRLIGTATSVFGRFPKATKTLAYSIVIQTLLMNPTARLPKPTEWRALYRAAILETDKSLIRQQVSAAEDAVLTVLAREREVLHTESDSDEQEALEDALYLLRAYKSAWQHTDAA